MVDKYGVEHSMQHPEILSRALRTSYAVHKSEVNGRTIEYQGYELFVLQRLEQKFGALSVKTQFEGIPMLQLDNGTYYQPDLYVKPKKTLVEVKSTWTLYGNVGAGGKALKRNRLIQKSANTQGVKLRFVVAFPKQKRVVMLPTDWYAWDKATLISYITGVN